ASSPEKDAHLEQVNLVLNEIDAEAVPQLLVFNKIDVLGESPRVDYDENGAPKRVWLSAMTGEGIDLLIIAVSQLLSNHVIETTLSLSPNQGQLRAELFALGAVLGEDTDVDGTINMRLRIEQHRLERIARRAGMVIG
ncbi:MAG: GTPase HflX, partial [Pseudomonadales bacterium]